MVVELLHVILLKARMAVFRVSVPPSWGMSSCGDCSFFYVLHHQVSDSGTHGRSHGTAERLLVVFLFVGKKVVFQDELQQLHERTDISVTNIFMRDFFSWPGICRETTKRETNILTFQMFMNPSRNHAQWSLVVSVLA